MHIIDGIIFTYETAHMLSQSQRICDKIMWIQKL